MPTREHRSDAGSSTVLALGIIAVMITVTVAALVVLGAVRAAHTARSAADLAALAGAVEYQRRPGGSACVEARRVARRHEVEMVTCGISAGGEVTVTTAAPIPLRLGGVGPEHAEGRARAGPQPSEAG